MKRGGGENTLNNNSSINDNNPTNGDSINNDISTISDNNNSNNDNNSTNDDSINNDNSPTNDNLLTNNNSPTDNTSKNDYNDIVVNEDTNRLNETITLNEPIQETNTDTLVDDDENMSRTKMNYNENENNENNENENNENDAIDDDNDNSLYSDLKKDDYNEGNKPTMNGDEDTKKENEFQINETNNVDTLKDVIRQSIPDEISNELSRRFQNASEEFFYISKIIKNITSFKKNENSIEGNVFSTPNGILHDSMLK